MQSFSKERIGNVSGYIWELGLLGLQVLFVSTCDVNSAYNQMVWVKQKLILLSWIS